MFVFNRLAAMAIIVITVLTATPAFAQREGGRGVPGVRAVIKAIDVKAGTITLTTGFSREGNASDVTYALSKELEIGVGASGGFRGPALFKKAELHELAPGVLISATLSADQKTIEAIAAEEPTVRGNLRSVDAAKKTLTVVTMSGGGREQPANEVDTTYTVAVDAEIAIDDGRGRRFSIHEGKLEDLSPGALVTLRLTLDKKKVNAVLAEGATVTGVVKEADATRRTLTITLQNRGEEGSEDRVLKISRDALITLDDGGGRLLSVKEGKLADVPVGAMITARLAVDQGLVMSLRAEGTTVSGILKGIDADKGIITIAIPKSRTEVDEKSYTLVKGGRVNIDGNNATLADLKVGDNGPLIQLRLALDQKTAQSVISRQPGMR